MKWMQVGAVLLSVLVMSTIQSAVEPDTQNMLSIELQTDGGIKQGKNCRLYKQGAQGVAVAEYIVCDDGTEFDAPVAVKDQAADMPVTEYTNYIGSYLIENAPSFLRFFFPNSGQQQKKVMYFNGEPKRER